MKKIQIYGETRRREHMAYLAVIDTETNWNDAVMSIGIALAEEGSLCLRDSRYYAGS